MPLETTSALYVLATLAGLYILQKTVGHLRAVRSIG